MKGGGYPRFLLRVGLVTVALALLGSVPTLRLTGPQGLRALLAACVVSLVASVAGSLPIALGRDARTSAVRALAGSGIRFAVTVALALPLVLSEAVSRRPFLIWLGLSYVVLLALDTRYAVTVTRAHGDAATGESAGIEAAEARSRME